MDIEDMFKPIKLDDESARRLLYALEHPQPPLQVENPPVLATGEDFLEIVRAFQRDAKRHGYTDFVELDESKYLEDDSDHGDSVKGDDDDGDADEGRR